MSYPPSPSNTLALYQATPLSNNFSPSFCWSTTTPSPALHWYHLLRLQKGIWQCSPWGVVNQAVELFSITGPLWLLLTDYLTDRWQLTSIDGVSSSSLPVTSGVPQGSILGPLLSIIYINDLPQCISTSSPLLYADDCKCLGSISSLLDFLLLQQDLDSLHTWKLTFNLCKCKSKSISTSSEASSHTYSMNDLQLTNTAHYWDLGVIFTNDLWWSHHYSIFIIKPYNTLHVLRRAISPHHSARTEPSLYTFLIRSHLTYSCQVWYCQLLKDIKKLKKVQWCLTKFILNDYHSNYKDRFIPLELLPLSLWLEFLDITFLHRMPDPTTFNSYPLQPDQLHNQN